MPTSISRAVTTTVATTALVLLAGGAAEAHVTVDAPGAAQGGYAVATFRVPTESDTASTTALTVTVPNLKSARTEPVPGWSAKVERNDKKEITAITWTADPGAPGIPPGQFQRFAVSVGPLPALDSVSFPAEQTYSDGKVVSWDQPVQKGGDEPEHPAPSITLAAAKDDGDGHKVSSEAADEEDEHEDETARWLGGIGLALGLLGVALGLGNVIRGRRA
ncbi:YcnI family protein [Nocardia implantans]|uniref:YcnI family protein n=1 Tax=Nocardia implantans TaxID=3108168 RepID=A0ABU6AN80_9NOCA|nr:MULTISPECIES: YcnI family protein [unclassified Nocardia]MBF6192095.1 YcnI family protein [Nocardia beijingensis]MEA3530227.1 YcnI family protein [Nocardia sp. CDC192]MEB3508935.1 YcnI family protein [Nocardia sp. CDC186]